MENWFNLIKELNWSFNFWKIRRREKRGGGGGEAVNELLFQNQYFMCFYNGAKTNHIQKSTIQEAGTFVYGI